MKKYLLTPGPLTTHPETKSAMQTDFGSRDTAFIKIIQDVRDSLLELAGVNQEMGYESVIMQGSGTFGLEAVVSTFLANEDCMLICINGAYGKRMKKIAEIYNINHITLEFDENKSISAEDVSEILLMNPNITFLSIVHCETTTGIMNDIASVGELCKKRNVTCYVDAMSSFGAVPYNMKEMKSDIMVSSSNKCIEGVPGFSFAIIKRRILERTNLKPRSLSLDLVAQWQGLEKNGQFRFTPPVHTIVAFHKALELLKEEGGVNARAERYSTNNEILVSGMKDLGFETYLDKENRGYIITSFITPDEDWFNFEIFYNKLNERGYIIYPGKLSEVDTFRIGNIGQIYPEDIKNLISAIKEVKDEMLESRD
jgi:2-aminoethylphosphonate-pyruvate transaminase